MYSSHPTPLSAVLLGAVLLALVTLFAQSVAHARSIECWKSHEGVQECGDSVPPEYAQQRIEVINDQGIVIQVREPAKTKAQLREAARRAAAVREAKARAEEQARRDRNLLDTFGSVNDITLVRKQKIATIQSLINVTRSNIALLEHKLDLYVRRAANRQRAGRPVPRSLLKDMAMIKHQIQEKRAHIAKQQAEQTAIRTEYAGYIRRFKTLTSQPH